MDKAISDLDPRLQPLAEQFLIQCNAQFTTRIIVTWRSATDQNDAKMKGLSNASAGESPHNCTDANGNPASRAFDFGVFESDGTYVQDGTDVRYAQAGNIAVGLGLAWGGDFHSFKDFDHVEMENWKSANEQA